MKDTSQVFQIVFNPSVPDSLTCVGARWRQIGAFWPLRRNCTRLRNHRKSWIVSNVEQRFFYHTLKLEHRSNQAYSRKKDNSAMIFKNFHDFLTLRADCARLRGRRILERVLLQLQFMVKERQPDILTLFSRFYDLSVSRDPLSKSKKREICKNLGTFFF